MTGPVNHPATLRLQGMKSFCCTVQTQEMTLSCLILPNHHQLMDYDQNTFLSSRHGSLWRVRLVGIDVLNISQSPRLPKAFKLKILWFSIMHRFCAYPASFLWTSPPDLPDRGALRIELCTLPPSWPNAQLFGYRLIRSVRKRPRDLRLSVQPFTLFNGRSERGSDPRSI